MNRRERSPLARTILVVAAVWAAASIGASTSLALGVERAESPRDARATADGHEQPPDLLMARFGPASPARDAWLRTLDPATTDPHIATAIQTVRAPTSCPIAPQNQLLGGGVLKGRVTAVATGNPIKGVSVSADDDMGDTAGYHRTAETDANGNYTITKLLTGQFVVRFDPGGINVFFGENYTGEYYNNHFRRSQANPVSVVSGTTVSNVNAALSAGAVLSGKVVRQDTGQIFPAYSAYAFTFADDDVTSGYASVYIGDTGRYTITGLSPGTYRVGVGLFDTAGPYPSMYYSNTYEYENATPVTLTVSAVVTNVNIAVKRGAMITGTLTREDTGATLANAFVAAGPVREPFYYANDSTRADGRYTLTVPSGTYVVHFYPPSNAITLTEEYYNNKPDFASATRITVTAPAVTPNVNAVLNKGGQLTGRATNAANGQGLNGYTSGFRGTVLNANTGEEVGTAFADQNGYFTTTMGLRTGSYKFRADASGFMPKYFHDKPDFGSANVINVTAPNVTANINQAIAPCPVYTRRTFVPLARR